MSSGFRRVVVQVKAVRDLSEQGTKTRVYVRSRLDTSVPLVNNDDTTFATNVIEVFFGHNGTVARCMKVPTAVNT